MDPRVRASVEAAIKQCADLGAELIDISLPHTEYAVSVYYIIATAESSANLARFDGVRYGNRAQDEKDIVKMYSRTRELGFGSEVKRRIILGTYVLSSGYYDAYYLRAQKVRTLIRRDFEAAHEKGRRHHLPDLAGPRIPHRRTHERPAPHVPCRHLHDRRESRGHLRNQRAVRIRSGGESRLPVGLQFLGKSLDETKLLGIADSYERASGYSGEFAKI